MVSNDGVFFTRIGRFITAFAVLAIEHGSGQEVVALSGVLAVRKVLLDVVLHSTFVVDEDHVGGVDQVVGGISVLGGLVCLEHTGIPVVSGLTRRDDLGNFPEVLVGDEAGVGALVDDSDMREGVLIISGAELVFIPLGNLQPIGAVPVDPACISSTTHHTNNRHQILISTTSYHLETITHK